MADKAGERTVTVTIWTEPGAKPEVSTMTAKSEMILGGRYLKEEILGEVFGLPFAGIGYTGYDNTTGTVTATWIDNMSTSTMVMTGKYAQAGDPLDVSGRTMLDPSTGVEVRMRSVTTWKNKDEHHIDYYDALEGGDEIRSMAMDYKRFR